MKNDLEVYNKIHNLVIEFQNGNKDSGLDLLECFKNYTNKYVDLIKFGIFETKNKSLKKFISIFFRNINWKLYKDFNNPDNLNFWNNRAQRISSIFGDISKEEVTSIVQYSILKMAKIYNSKNPTFHTYISRCLHYFIYNEVKKLIKDPVANSIDLYCDNLDKCTLAEMIMLNKTNFYEDSYEKDQIDERINIEFEINKSDISIKSNNLEAMEDSFLDINWINGITCSEQFKELTPFERKIILDHTIYKKTDTQIANEYGCVRATINRKRLKAISKIKLL